MPKHVQTLPVRIVGHLAFPSKRATKQYIYNINIYIYIHIFPKNIAIHKTTIYWTYAGILFQFMNYFCSRSGWRVTNLARWKIETDIGNNPQALPNHFEPITKHNNIIDNRRHYINCPDNHSFSHHYDVTVWKQMNYLLKMLPIIEAIT